MQGTSPRRPNSDTSELVPLRTEPGVYAYDLWRNLTIGVWVGPATLAAVRGLAEVTKLARTLVPGKRSAVTFVLDQLPAPLPDAQAELARVYDFDGLACTVLLLEGTGFWASAIRSMSVNNHRTASTTKPLYIATSLDEVVAWLPEVHQRLTGVTLPPDELRSALSLARVSGAARGRTPR